jgi:hypothetical protein
MWSCVLFIARINDLLIDWARDIWPKKPELQQINVNLPVGNSVGQHLHWEALCFLSFKAQR